jgi:hypothetical protein
MATNIYLITNEQRDVLINSENEFIKFIPIQDINDNYFISENEYYYCLGLWYIDELNSELIFIKDLTSSIYEPKIVENPLI